MAEYQVCGGLEASLGGIDLSLRIGGGRDHVGVLAVRTQQWFFSFILRREKLKDSHYLDRLAGMDNIQTTRI